MLSENDLACKIAEYRCKENISENDCVKLASFLTVRDCLYPQYEEEQPRYSYADSEEKPSKKTIAYKSDSEFFKLVNGMEVDDVFPIIEELMETVKVINPRLYAGVIRKLT